MLCLAGLSEQARDVVMKKGIRDRFGPASLFLVVEMVVMSDFRG